MTIKICIISNQSPLARDLNKVFNDRGYISKLITVNGRNSSPEIVSISRLRGFTLWLKVALRSYIYRYILLNVDPKYQYFKDIDENQSYYSSEKIIKLIGAVDYILVIFDYRILTTRTIQEIYLSTKTKIIWLLTDMSPLTGGCSYSWNCDEYIRNCKNCPAVKNSFFKKFPSYTLQAKMKNLSCIDIHPVAFSSPQFIQAKRSALFRNSNVRKAFFPVNYEIFCPVERKGAVSKLGLPENKRYFLLGAVNLKESRKGMVILLEALKKIEMQLFEANVTIMIVGNNVDAVLAQNYKFDYKIFGQVSYTELAKAYQASDLFICPSLEDSGPTMINQSILCGTPVVSFEVGVACDLVKDSKTGFIAKSKSAESLAIAIEKFINLSGSQLKYMFDQCILMRQSIIKDDFVNKFSREFLQD